MLAGAGLYRFTGRGFKAREDYYDFLDATVAAEQVSEVLLTAAGAAVGAAAGAPAGVYRMRRNNAQAVSCDVTIAVTRCLFACVCGCIRCKLHGEAIVCGKQLQTATLTS